MSVDHYENFPVASLLLPKRLRRAVTDIYRFARGADDLADEGDATPSERNYRVLPKEPIRCGQALRILDDPKLQRGLWIVRS